MIYGIITGIVAGYIACRIQKGKGSGCVANLLIGIIGGVVGNWLFSMLGLSAHGWIGEIVTAVAGAVVILWIFGKRK